MSGGGRCGWAFGWKAVDTEIELSTSGSEVGYGEVGGGDAYDVVLAAGESAAAGECRFIEAAAAARSLPVCTWL